MGARCQSLFGNFSAGNSGDGPPFSGRKVALTTIFPPDIMGGKERKRFRAQRPESGGQIRQNDPDAHSAAHHDAGGPHDHQHDDHLGLQHGGHLFRRPDRHQRDRRGGRRLFADGGHPGDRVHVRAGLGQLHRPQPRRPGFPGRLAHVRDRFFLGADRRRTHHPLRPYLPRPARAAARRDRDDPALRAGLRAVHPARRVLHDRVARPQ